MQILKSKQIMLLIISLAAIFALGVNTSIAQEKIKVNKKLYLISIKSEQIEVDDIEGHVLTMGMNKGIDVSLSATRFGWNTCDLVNGNGNCHGYSKSVDEDGDVIFGKSQGKRSTMMSPKGEPLLTYQGTWFWTGGTGKWKNVQGGGTYEGKQIGPGISFVESEGEYFIKK